MIKVNASKKREVKASKNRGVKSKVEVQATQIVAMSLVNKQLYFKMVTELKTTPWTTFVSIFASIQILFFYRRVTF